MWSNPKTVTGKLSTCAKSKTITKNNKKSLLHVRLSRRISKNIKETKKEHVKATCVALLVCHMAPNIFPP
jgi:hypothetical protein